jgi:hypothetical protein
MSKAKVPQIVIDWYETIGPSLGHTVLDEDDNIERITCPKAGQDGHRCCGYCPKCGAPNYCGCHCE